jgi:hypothetical protein
MTARDTDFIDTFFLLLRAGMYGTPVPEEELPESIDWDAVVGLAKKHIVLGIIIEGIQFLPDRLHPSCAVSAKMNRFALRLIQNNLVLDKTAARLTEFLARHGIDGVLLKGPGVARYYRMSQMRQSGDIDFYVGKKYYRQASALCREKLTGDKSSCAETEQHFDFDMDGITVELHRIASRFYSPLRNRRFQDWVTEELEHSEDRRTLSIGDADVPLPSVDFDAIFIFYHAWRHYVMGGIGLRQLCDWAMIFHSHSGDIDTERLKDNIRRFGMTKGWKLFACIAVRHLGVPESQMPLYDRTYAEKSERVLEDIIAGGNFGYYSELYRQTVARKSFIGGFKGKVRMAIRNYTLLFPLMPAEATFLCINRMIFGTRDFVKRTTRKP